VIEYESCLLLKSSDSKGHLKFLHPPFITLSRNYDTGMVQSTAQGNNAGSSNFPPQVRSTSMNCSNSITSISSIRAIQTVMVVVRLFVDDTLVSPLAAMILRSMESNCDGMQDTKEQGQP
jgi:hypothetical protein